MNEREGVTIYGSINYKTHKTVVREYKAGNGENTVDYVEYLRMLSGYENILLLWDSASYHKNGEMKKYLEKINRGLDEKDWRVTCLPLARYAPDQNPVEDIWLNGKNGIRQKFSENKTFRAVKECFMQRIRNYQFSFDKLSIFGTV